MTQAAVDVVLNLKLNDQASAAMGAAADRAGKAAEAAAKKSLDMATKYGQQERDQYGRTADARAKLGIRAERDIQKEIAETQRAYGKLAAEGWRSAQEQTRAFEATRNKITQLTNEMGKFTAAQQKAAEAAKNLARGQGALTATGATAAAAYAGYSVLKDVTERAQATEVRIGLMANTAYAERDSKGRLLGEKELFASVKGAVRGGMRSDDAANTLDKLIAGNQVGGAKGAMELMPWIARVATGSGSQGTDIAAMMGAIISQGYGKDIEGAKKMAGLAFSSTVAGSFEKKDMARHLPSILANAANNGLTGEAGFKRVMIIMQQAMTTAANADEAAVNVNNLLSKINSQDTANDFKKAGRGDLAGHLLKKRAEGVDPIKAWQEVIEADLQENPKIKTALKRLDGIKDPAQKAEAQESINAMVQGTAIGRYFQDMQARKAFFAVRNKEVEDGVTKSFAYAPGIVDRDAEHMLAKNGIKRQIAEESVALAKTEVANKVGGTGAVSEVITDLADKFPMLTGSVAIAVPAVAAMGASAVAAAMALRTLSGKPMVPGAVASKVGGALGNKYVAGGLKGGAIGIAAGLGGAAISGIAGEESVAGRYGSSALNGVAIGAMVGSIVPVVGTAIGAAIGGGLGLIYQGLQDSMKPKEDSPKMEAKLQVEFMDINDRLVARIANQQLTTNGVNATVDTGNIMYGAP